ncbi:MAG: hypothetical protein OIF51_09685 [Cellvibrionaceae bacterium]|nr:hypothetical protein [Cellvibrionaceae bacterium]
MSKDLIDKTGNDSGASLETEKFDSTISGRSIVKKVSSTGKIQAIPFPHGLGRVPLFINIQFSPDNSFDDVFLVQWPWQHDLTRGPVSIRMDTQNVYLEFTTGHVFGEWSAVTNNWQKYSAGYYKVIVFG